jgi:Flp pilus assembly protein TadG
MLDTVVFRRLRAAARRFAGANDGNIAIIFGIAVIPIITFVGAAVDYTRAVSARSSMQAALDSTVLMLGKDLTEGTIDPSQISTKADAYFRALYTNTEVKSVEIKAEYTQNTGNGSTVLVKGSGNIETGFMRVVGFPTMDFKSNSTSTWGMKRMRVALVLDNTGSMDSNGKMGAMKKAATDMVTDLSAYSKKTGDVYISIIPFAKDVNVGTANVDASWINWSEWEAEPPILKDTNYPIKVSYNGINYTWADIGPGAPCPFDTTGSGRPTNNSTVKPYGFGCMNRPATVSGATDVSQLSTNKWLIPSSGSYAGMICPSIDSGSIYQGKKSIYYNGCYTSVVDQTITLSTGNSAACPAGKPNCSCSGSGSSKKCVQTTYKHYWRSHPTDSTQAANAAPAHNASADKGGWTGCINDRDQAYDTWNTAPGSNGSSPSTQFYAEEWSQCLTSTVTPMSEQWQVLKDKINAMVASGNTNQAVGLAWGWQSLSTDNDPIKAPPKDLNNYVYRDYIVLLSDGLNTQNRWSSSETSINDRQKILCQNIKNDKVHPVTVFTIQVNINSADPQSQVLKECATPDGSFQMITSSSETSSAFKNILTQISKLRVSK